MTLCADHVQVESRDPLGAPDHPNGIKLMAMILSWLNWLNWLSRVKSGDKLNLFLIHHPCQSYLAGFRGQ
jgi:hypothetical protein